MSLTLKQLSCSSVLVVAVSSLTLVLSGCPAKPPQAAAGPPQAMPVQVSNVELQPVPTGDTYVATIKSRRSATIQPQVDGNLTKILVVSGQSVAAGQLLMTIDPLKQQATVQQQQGTQAQKKAVLDYNRIEEDRQRQLFQSGVISRDAYDQALQALQNSQGDYSSTVAQTRTQQEQLAYYQIRAPFAGIIGDIPVHQGDYVSPTTLLTTLDEKSGLEAYIYIPTDRAAQVKIGLPVDLVDNDGKAIVHSTISFLSPQVDNGTQTILAKAEIPTSAAGLIRNQQLVKAKVIWSTNPVPVIPVLAVTRIGGQPFVFVAAPTGNGYQAQQVAVTLGDSIGNTFPVLSGLKTGDKVIISGLQLMADKEPVKPLN
ncbi:MAG TPA: efflux RND transporter periplasmic adaptor subunit [Acidobacteriaceae bacterium]